MIYLEHLWNLVLVVAAVAILVQLAREAHQTWQHRDDPEWQMQERGNVLLDLWLWWIELRNPPRKTDPVGRIEMLVWTCKCHGHHYSDPRHCLHTDASNLIPPDQFQSPVNGSVPPSHNGKPVIATRADGKFPTNNNKRTKERGTHHGSTN